MLAMPSRWERSLLNPASVTSVSARKRRYGFLVGEAECAAGDLGAVEIHPDGRALPCLRRLLRRLLDALLVAGRDLHVLDDGLRHAELADHQPGLRRVASQLSARAERAARNGQAPRTSHATSAAKAPAWGNGEVAFSIRVPPDAVSS
jgi:hypothetical protein